MKTQLVIVSMLTTLALASARAQAPRQGGAQPANPGVQPVNPGVQPVNPGVQPVNPGAPTLQQNRPPNMPMGVTSQPGMNPFGVPTNQFRVGTGTNLGINVGRAPIRFGTSPPGFPPNQPRFGNSPFAVNTNQFNMGTNLAPTSRPNSPQRIQQTPLQTPPPVMPPPPRPNP